MNRVSVHLLCLLSIFVFGTALNEDQLEECEPGYGQCICIDQCNYAKDLIRAHKLPQLCGYEGEIPKVCCPKPSNLQALSPGKKSTDSCKRFYPFQLAFTHAGVPALSEEFPHMAILGYGENDTTVWLCGGTLIAEQYVLTAAHCLYSEKLGYNVKKVRLGELDIKSTTDVAMPEDYGIAETFAHPNYQSSSHYNDIALIKLDRNATFNQFVYPACLYTEYDVPKDQWLILTGWGQTESFGEMSSHLLKVSLNYISHQNCANSYSRASDQKLLRNGIIDEIQICAGAEDGRDACPGDSGGPLQLEIEPNNLLVKSFHHSVVGVTSFGRVCSGENSVGVYTRVAPFTAWIENIVWP